MIVRSRHPFEGQALPVLGRMRRHGRVELLVVLPDGSKRLIPASWTDLDTPGAPDGAPGASPAGTLGSVADLLHAVAVVRGLAARVRDEAGQAARQSPSKEDNRAACAAQSDPRPGPGATGGPPRAASRPGRRGGDGAAGRPDRQGDQPAGGGA
jgi:hypothetical protein